MNKARSRGYAWKSCSRLNVVTIDKYYTTHANVMSQITTHVLDTTHGKPAAGVTIILFADQHGDWKEMNRGVTNEDGRITGLVNSNERVKFGLYMLRFRTREYFAAKGVSTFYPFVDIIFDIQSAEHYHVPLLLNPFGYSTYRGS